MPENQIIVLLSGNLRFGIKENLNFLKKYFENYNLIFLIVTWKNENIKLIKKFKKIYKPYKFYLIKQKNYKKEIKLIKFADNAINIENIFHMWKGIIDGFKFIKKLNLINKKNSYILRYRSDIFPLIKDCNFNYTLKKNEILIPDRFHWNGINDQFFLIRYQDINLFDGFFKFLKNHIQKNNFFCAEFIFYLFIKFKKFKIKFINFNYKILRVKNKNINLRKKKSKIKFKNLIIIKFLKFLFKFRNFKSYFIYKKNRNREQYLNIKKINF